MIRPATDADFSAFAPIMRGAILSHGPKAYSDAECASWIEGVREALFLRGRDEGQVFLCAGPVGAPQGFCSYLGASLVGLYVSPEAMGHGLGSALLEAAEVEMRGAGSPQSLTAALNTEGFYAERGWVTTLHKPHLTRGGLTITVADMQKA